MPISSSSCQMWLGARQREFLCAFRRQQRSLRRRPASVGLSCILCSDYDSGLLPSPDCNSKVTPTFVPWAGHALLLDVGGTELAWGVVLLLADVILFGPSSLVSDLRMTFFPPLSLCWPISVLVQGLIGIFNVMGCRRRISCRLGAVGTVAFC